MIDWVLDAVREAGADAITVVVNPHHAEVAAHLDGRAEVVYQREPNGTAHALQQVEDLTGDVLVVNGDSPLLTAGTIRRIVDSHRQAKRPATLAGVEDASRDDGRIVRGKDGEFDRIVDGIYCFDGGRLKGALAMISNDNKAGEYYLTDVFLHLQPVNVVRLADPSEAMGVKDRARLAAATAIMQRRILERIMEEGVTIIDPASTFIDATVTIGQDTTVEPFSVIKGHTKIGTKLEPTAASARTYI